MSDIISNPSADQQEKIANAAKVLGRSKDRCKVFNAIYYGKKKIKTVPEIAKYTKLKDKRVLEEGKKLADNHIVEQTKQNKKTAYQKIDFYYSHKDEIIRLATNPAKLVTFPTRSNPRFGLMSIKIPRQMINARSITIDDLDSFKKVRGMNRLEADKPGYEKKFKNILKKILGEKGKFTDWGGESNDLFSTRLVVNGKRQTVAFALKGKGTKGKLVPKKMGKNGDQIQRLFQSPAEVFIIQYGGEIDQAILEQMRIFAISKSVMLQKRIYYGIIDGSDTARIVKKYSN